MNLDEMGPESAKSFLGKQVVHTQPDIQTGKPAERARQEIDYGRRKSGYIFGAFRPATGEALTLPYDRRTTVNWINFLDQVEQWIPASVERIYAILDNLSMHRATDVLLFCLAHPRWEFVFQPTYAAYLNPGGRRCVLWRSKASASRPRMRSAMPWPKRPSIGMLIVILSFGDAGAGIARVVYLGSLSQLLFVNLVDAPLR